MSITVPHVYHLVISLEPGGLEQLVVNWTNARNRRHPDSTEIVTLDEPGQLAGQIEGGRVRALKARRSAFPWDRHAVSTLRSLAVPGAIIHSHNLSAQQYAALALRNKKAGHLHTEHGSNPHVTGMLNRFRLRMLGRRTDACVCVSHDTAEQMGPLWGRGGKAVRVIPNGVATPEKISAGQIETLKASLFSGPEGFLIGSVGRLSPEKGYDRLIRAIADMRKTIRLVLVGDGPERHHLEDLAEELDCASQVLFAGFRPDARELMQVFDLFVLSSKSEGLPVALLEAMAAGCPVAAPRVGDCARVLKEGACGCLLPNDAAAWPTLLASLVDNTETLEAMAHAGREQVEAHYSEASALDAYEALYRNLVEQTA